jgi:hypothetical protein
MTYPHIEDIFINANTAAVLKLFVIFTIKEKNPL